MMRSFFLFLFTMVIWNIIYASSTGCIEWHDRKGALYRGNLAVTKSGYICQRWDSQYPNTHNRTPQNFPYLGLEANYCRNPDGEGAPWCYNKEGKYPRFEYCDVPRCYTTSRDCIERGDYRGERYRGKLNVTRSGLPCQNWDSLVPNRPPSKNYCPALLGYTDAGLEQNFCRNPDREPGPWCYNKLGLVPRWDFCSIPRCKQEGCHFVRYGKEITDSLKADGIQWIKDGYRFYPIQKPSVSTTIELTLKWDLAIYKQVEDCYFTISLDDVNDKQIYGLYFDMKSREQRSPRLQQFRDTFSFTGDFLETDLSSILKEVNRLSLSITTDSYKVNINGHAIESSFKVQWDRLLEFKTITIKGGGCCLKVYLDSNFLDIKETGTCPPLKIDNGMATPRGQIPEGVSVTIVCEVGYKLSHKHPVKCQQSPSYNTLPPTCIPINQEKRTPLSEFTVDVNNPQHAFTDQILEVSAMFLLKVIFNGRYEMGCGVTFSILDEEEMYTFSIYTESFCFEQTVTQNSRSGGKWTLTKKGEVESELPDLGEDNEIIVLVTDKHYLLSLNGEVIKASVEIDVERLQKFRGISIEERGNCLKVDRHHSYMANKSILRFKLVSERGTDFGLKRNPGPGLLLAQWAGHLELGKVCGKNFNDRAASLICQEMGYKGAKSWTDGINWHISDNFISLVSEVKCGGNESKFENCDYRVKINLSSLCYPVFLTCYWGEDACVKTEHNGFMKNVCTDSRGNQYFKCLQSDTYYRVDQAIPQYSKFSKLCENDPKFYQVCGGGHREFLSGNQEKTFCGYYLCKEAEGRHRGAIYTSGNIADYDYECDGKKQCSNTDLDESDCDPAVVAPILFALGDPIKKSKVCDGYCDRSYCGDESLCNGYYYGTNCVGWYIPPYMIGVYSETPTWPQCVMYQKSRAEYTCRHFTTGIEVPIFDFTRCAALRFKQSVIDHSTHVKSQYHPYCEDFSDQTNCTDTSKISLNCTVKGFNSTIPEQMICHGLTNIVINKITHKKFSLCDDGIENKCVNLSPTCNNLHKHRMCDNDTDCHDESDEKDIVCKEVTKSSCARRVGGRVLPIPVSWLMDGTTDCVGGEDEAEGWLTCGKDETSRYVRDNSYCKDDYHCLDGAAKYIAIDQLCDGIETCGNENEVCKRSRGNLEFFTETLSVQPGVKQLMYCFKGLDKLHSLTSQCFESKFRYPKEAVFGSERQNIFMPNTTADCTTMYGEHYVYFTCENRCINKEPCPITRPIQHDSCPGQYPDRIYSVANNTNLTFLIKSRGSYRNDLFVCEDNGCIPYSKVCDLVEDCYDGSDEISCKNNFRCKSNETYIAVTQKCDGKIDCLDFSDECNDECGKRIIEEDALKVASWAIGLLAVLFNSMILFQSVPTLRKSTSSTSLLNKLLVLLIGIGDLMLGAYLLAISAIDHEQGKTYCKNQKVWLTSNACSILGVVSTVGSQFSLFSMTMLSCVRLYGVRNAMRIGRDLTKLGVVKVGSVCLILVLISLAIAIVPLLPSLEDYFVNGLTYNSSQIPLFASLTDKEKHFRVIEAYYGRMRNQTLSWELIRNLMSKMFSNNYEGVISKDDKFYGNDGVCLFKYFVDLKDPQHLYVWSVLMVNLSCFVIISLSYILIAAESARSAKRLSVNKENKAVKNRNERMNRKISVIILTDFCCWVPFIVSCGLHTLRAVDASSWYSLFSIVVLPINSVINPVLYDNLILKYVGITGNFMRKTLSRIPGSVRSIYKSRGSGRNTSSERNTRSERNASTQGVGEIQLHNKKGVENGAVADLRITGHSTRMESKI